MFFPPSGNLDLRGFEDPDENFVQLVNSVPLPPHTSIPSAGALKLVRKIDFSREVR
jgi:hypothetical protein